MKHSGILILFLTIASAVFSSVYSAKVYSAERWSPVDLSKAAQTALSDFKEFYYDLETWKQIRSYNTVNTPAGALVKITYNNYGQLVTTNFTCRYLNFEGMPRMSCREH